MSITLRTKKSRLRRLATRLEATPRRKFNQREWCGTACCIAGHTIFEFGSKKERAGMNTAEVENQTYPQSFDLAHRAQELLGLTENERRQLFQTVSFWPQCYKTRKGNVTPRLAAKALRDLVDTIHP